MTTPFADFSDRRIRGADILDTLAEALRPTRMTDVAERLEGLAERARAGRFVVLLIGCFSTGKSTLVNALLSRPATGSPAPTMKGFGQTGPARSDLSSARAVLLRVYQLLPLRDSIASLT